MYSKYGQQDSSWIADSVEDLNSIPKSNIGSSCYVIENASKYIVNSKGVWVNQEIANTDKTIYNSLEDLQNSNDLKEGIIYKTLGYYEPNDGGAAQYLIDTTGNIKLSNNLYATLLIENEMNVECFGAKGDGITDDSKAIELASSHDIIVNFLNKTYLIQNTIKISKDTHWSGKINTKLLIDDSYFKYVTYDDRKYNDENTNPIVNNKYSIILIDGQSNIENINVEYHSRFLNLDQSEFTTPAVGEEYPANHLIRMNSGKNHYLKNVKIDITEEKQTFLYQQVDSLPEELQEGIIYLISQNSATNNYIGYITVDRYGKKLTRSLGSMIVDLTAENTVTFRTEVVPMWYNLTDIGVIHNLYVDNCNISNLTTGHHTGTGCLWAGCFAYNITNDEDKIIHGAGVFDKIVVQNSIFTRNYSGDIVSFSSNHNLIKDILVDNCTFNASNWSMEGSAILQFGCSANYPTKFDRINVRNCDFNIETGFGAPCIASASPNTTINIDNCSFYKDSPMPKYYKVNYDEETGEYTLGQEIGWALYGKKVEGARVPFEDSTRQVYTYTYPNGTTTLYTYEYDFDNLDYCRRLHLFQVEENCVINMNNSQIDSVSSMIWNGELREKSFQSVLNINNSRIYSWASYYNATNVNYHNCELIVGSDYATANNRIMDAGDKYNFNINFDNCVIDAVVYDKKLNIEANNCNFKQLVHIAPSAKDTSFKARNSIFSELRFDVTAEAPLGELLLNNNLIESLTSNGNELESSKLNEIANNSICWNNCDTTNKALYANNIM